MLTNLRFLLTAILFTAGLAYAQTGNGTIKGTITDKESGDPLPFVKTARRKFLQLKVRTEL